MSRFSRASLAWLAALMAAEVEAMAWLPWRRGWAARMAVDVKNASSGGSGLNHNLFIFSCPRRANWGANWQASGVRY